MHRLIPFAALALLAACADSEPPDPTPAEDDGAYNLVDPVAAPIADDTQPAIGIWVESMQEEQPILQFGPANTEPLFSIRCDDREGLLLQRHGVVSRGGAEMMTLMLDGTAERLAVNPVQGPLPILRAAVSANDDVIVRLANAEAPIRIEIGDDPPVLLPTSPMIGEFIAGCASEGGAPEPDAATEATANSAE